MNCGPVAFDVVQRKGQQVEGFSANAWRQIQENIAEVKVRRSKSAFKKSYAWTCYRRCDDH